MSHLRDARTSELIAEGTPLELVTIVDELGLKAGVVGAGESAEDLDAIYDDVGLGFDPNLVRQARDENLDALKVASTTAATPDDDERAAMTDAYAAAVAEVEQARDCAPDAQAALDEARERVA